MSHATLTSSRFTRFGLAALLALTCWTHTPAAHADDAEGHLTHGVELREQGRDDEALAEFRRAYALSATPRARAQIALAEQALGTWVSAEHDLTAALSASSDPWISKNHEALKSALATIGQHLGTLELRIEPSDARGGDVIVDGEPREHLPLRKGLRVEAGTRTLEVRLPGYYAISRAIIVPAGGVARETIELHPQTEASSEAATATPRPTTPPTERDAPMKSGGGGALGTVGWVFVGTSVALLATGVVGQFVRQGNISSYNNDPSCPGQGSATQPPSCADLVRSAQTWNTVSIVSFIGGGVFASSGIVLLLVNGSNSTSSAKTARVRCGPFGCAGTF